MMMPGRKYTTQNGYRYGFNGKEKDDDISSGDYEFGDRIYDSRLSRWLATDRMANAYPSISPYAYAINSPLIFYDPNGKWVVKVDFDSKNKKYSLTFTAEKGDDINTLATQLGIPKSSLVKADPTLNKLTVKTGTQLKLDKLVEVQNINKAITEVKNNEKSNNCANLADKSDGGSNVTDVINGNNVDLLATKLKNDYQQVDDKDARIGDIITYRLDPAGKTEALNDVKAILLKNFESTHNGKQPDAKEQATIDKTAETFIDGLYSGERHFTVVLLKNKAGTAIQNIIQKKGTTPLNVSDLSNNTDLNPSPLDPNKKHVQKYKRTPVEGTQKSIYRSKEKGAKT